MKIKFNYKKPDDWWSKNKLDEVQQKINKGANKNTNALVDLLKDFMIGFKISFSGRKKKRK